MKKHLTAGIGLLILFNVFTILVAFVDVKAIGRQNTDVGFASVNEAFHNFTGEHETLFEITEKAGYLAAVPVLIFGLIGLMQLIRGKSLKKVDADILLLGGFYVVLGICYVVFEKIVINYRPPYAGETVLEPSYPSSHTLLFVAVMVTAVMQVIARVQKKTARIPLILCCVAAALLVVIGRAVCGVHWFTDILGGILLAASLCWIYYALAFAGKKQKEETNE